MKVIMSKAAYAKTHKDFKGLIDGQRSVLRMLPNGATGIVAVEIDDGKPLRQGRKVYCNGYPGTIVRRYDGAMVEVRVPGGVCCVEIADLIFLED